MPLKNRYACQEVITPEQIEHYADTDLTNIVQGGLSYKRAQYLVETFPATVRQEKWEGESMLANVYSLELYIFSEQQLKEYRKKVEKDVMFNLAADRALYLLGGETCH